MIVEELSTKLRPRDIHAQTAEGVGHLLHGLAVRLVERHAHRSAGKTIVYGNVGRESQGIGYLRFARSTQRDLKENRGPIVDERSTFTRGWNTRDFNLVGNFVLEFCRGPYGLRAGLFLSRCRKTGQRTKY